MIPEKKKQIQTLVVLLVLLGGAATYTYLSLRKPAAAVTTPAEKAARVASLSSAGNARIRLDLIEAKPEKATVGRKNVFQYYVPPPAPKPVVPQTAQVDIRPAQTPQATPPVYVPPPPPSALTTFKYDGVFIVAQPGKLRVSIFDSATGVHYNVTEGEFILGRYRINKVTETTVEIEDVDQNRRQTYTRSTTA